MSNTKQTQDERNLAEASAYALLYTLGFKLEHHDWQKIGTKNALLCGLYWEHPMLPGLRHCARHHTVWLVGQIINWMEEDATLTIKDILRLLLIIRMLKEEV
jgi:hypothetical protein